MNTLSRLLNFLSRSIGHSRCESFIKKFSRMANVDLLMLAYHEMGILNWKNFQETGEAQLISVVLPKIINESQPIIFDVGANIGKFSYALREQFSNAKIYAFEPVTDTFNALQENLVEYNIRCINRGLGEFPGNQVIYSSADQKKSSKASLHKDVLTRAHKLDDVISIKICMDSVDNFCRENNILKIDFLKIDTEGNELEVLKGAKRMIFENKIHCVLFEFNEMNVFSRVFLKDFYELLEGYSFFRLNTNELIPMKTYKTRNEIFQFQNILAVNPVFSQKSPTGD